MVPFMCHQYFVPLTLVPMVSHDQNHFTPYFYHVNLTNVMVLLMVPQVSCDANTGHVGPHFSHLKLTK